MKISGLFQGIKGFFNFSNPWEGESFAEAGIARTQDKLTSGILGENHKDPNLLRDSLSKFMSLLGLLFGFEYEAYAITDENKKAEGRLNKLAVPSELAVA